MSQHDYVIANADGATVRADLNALFDAIASQNSGSTAPTTTFPLMTWFDTANNLLKLRTATNTAWVTVASLSGSTWIVYSNGAALPAVGTSIGNLLQLISVGSPAVAGLPAIDGSQLTGIPVAGTSIGDVVQIVGVGSPAVAGLPAIDGSQLTGVNGSDWQKVSEWLHAVSGDSTGVEFTSGITDSYDLYRMTGHGLMFSVAGIPLIQFREEGGSFLTANYLTRALATDGTLLTSTANGVPISAIANAVGTAAVDSVAFSVDFFSLREAALDPHCRGWSSIADGGVANGATFAGLHNADPVVDGIRFVPASGNITGGIIRLYRFTG